MFSKSGSYFKWNSVPATLSSNMNECFRFCDLLHKSSFCTTQMCALTKSCLITLIIFQNQHLNQVKHQSSRQNSRICLISVITDRIRPTKTKRMNYTHFTRNSLTSATIMNPLLDGKLESHLQSLHTVKVGAEDRSTIQFWNFLVTGHST